VREYYATNTIVLDDASPLSKGSSQLLFEVPPILSTRLIHNTFRSAVKNLVFK
jgi:hypothetical protein